MLSSELLPLGQGGRAALLESLAVDEMAFGVEVIVDIGVYGSELLRSLRLSEA